jgi:D-serine dehydratase
MYLDAIERLTLDGTVKGMPGDVAPFELRNIARQGWNVLRGDLPTPLLVLKASAVDANAAFMKAFAAQAGALLAPHGKTTMAPQLFARQLADGAWGLTCANVAQLGVYRRFGVPRVLYANQLTGEAEIGFVLRELRRDPEFDFYALVDSIDGAERLAAAAREAHVGRPVKLLVELGVSGGRTGCRTIAEALDVAKRVRALAPTLALAGVETFEGLVKGDDASDRASKVRALLADLAELARACSDGDTDFIVSAGGSLYLDLVVAALGRGPWRLVLRAGCYLAHDAGAYERAFGEMAARGPLPGRLVPALELWAHVLSRPEPTSVVVSFGKRDAPYDLGLPRAELWYRRGMQSAAPIGTGCETATLYDQHAALRVPESSPLGLGDLVGFGVSHPCAAFEKWGVVCVVDDRYDVVDAVKTFF